MAGAASYAEILQDEATVAIVGGGPAGAFLALHILDLADRQDKRPRVVVFERRRPVRTPDSELAFGAYRGCPSCAGGVSPRLMDALQHLGIRIPADVLQCRIHSITVQGNWKPIYLKVPEHREMLSVFRGTLPQGQQPGHEAFDGLLLDTAAERGAEFVGSRVTRVFYADDRRPVVCYERGGATETLQADFVAFAGGVNESSDPRVSRPSAIDLFRMLQPDYVPPRMRKALIVEVAASWDSDEAAQGTLHYIEGSMGILKLEMCSIMPKKGYVTLSLIGRSVDESTSHRENLHLIRAFLEIPRVRRVLPVASPPEIRCICNPRIVVGNAECPWAHRAAVVGDMATSRQYKDGILAAHDTARDLASVVFHSGVDFESLAADYRPTLSRFDRDNRFAGLIFFLYRWFFVSPLLSRILYQTFATERKREHPSRRSFERIFWNISSGDASYEQIAWAMIRPGTLWKLLVGGACVTVRNGLTERFFGLKWGMGRYPTAVPVETLRARRHQLMKGRRSEFECTYTIEVRAEACSVRALLAQLGEPGRPYLNPRWVRIRRVGGEPLHPGCRIRYRIFGGLLAFDIVQQASTDDQVIRFRVRGGFADGGSLVFLIEPDAAAGCSVSVYLAFDFPRGRGLVSRLYWTLFRRLFPKYLHDVLWNHALCEIRQLAENGSMTPSAPTGSSGTHPPDPTYVSPG